jgi:acyl carrier protein
MCVSKSQLRSIVTDIIKSIAPDEDLSVLDPDKPLREQIDLDSMDFLDIVMELRIRYNIDVPESDYPKLNSLSSTVNYLLPRMQGV